MTNYTAEEKFIIFIQSVIKRPGMYLVSKIEDLYFIFLGYRAGIVDCSRDETIENLISEFRNFVNLHFDSKEDHDWPRLIRFYSGGDSHSVDLFANIFNDFLHQKNSRSK